MLTLALWLNMARLNITLLLTFAALAYAVAYDAVENRKIIIIKRETVSTAALIRNITISSAQSKVQLASMATDFVSGLNYATFTINNVVPNVVGNEAEYKELADMAQYLSDAAHGIEQAIPGDSEKLKETLAVALDKMNDVAIKFDTFRSTNKFVNNQIYRKHDYIVFAIYHLKYEAESFEKTNKELEPEFDKGVKAFVDALNSLQTQSDYVEEELRHALQHFSVVTSRIIYKLENWIEINPDRTEDIKIVESVSKFCTELYDRQNRAASGHHKADYMKKELISMYTEGIKPVAKLVDVKYPDNSGGQEFIRSSLFDGITIGRAYADNIRTVVAKD